MPAFQQQTLERYYQGRKAINAARSQIIESNLVSGSFPAGFTVARNRLAELDRELERVNQRIKVLEPALVGAPSPVWASHLRISDGYPADYV